MNYVKKPENYDKKLKMEIYKIIDAENKSVAVIESCENEKQLEAAQQFIDGFRLLYKAHYSFSKLQLLLNNKREKII